MSSTRPISMTPQPAYIGGKNTWLWLLRLVTFCLILAVVVFWMGNPGYLQTPFLIYAAVTLITLVTLLTLRQTQFYLLFRFLVGLQIVCEIANEAGIVYTTGSMQSPYSALFLLTIVSASLIYRLAGTLIVASIVSLAYVTVTLINAAVFFPDGEWMQAFTKGLLQGDDTLFYSIFLHISIFYMVAFISGYLAARLQSKDTELRTRSIELEKARLETGDILRHLNSGLVTVDRFGDIVYFNRAAEVILGVSEADVSGKNIRAVFAGHLAPLLHNLLAAQESLAGATRSEFDIEREDSQTIPIGISTSILYDELDNLRGVIGVFQDLTEVKRLEEQMRHADRMAAIGELSACMAHEIRNPLAAISGSVEVLGKELQLSGDNARLMTLILKETGRLSKLLSDFLLYARSGRPQFQKLELHHAISEVMEITRRHPAFSPSIRLELLSAESVVYVPADEDQLKQVLLNLAINACESFDGSGGTIQFEISREEAGELDPVVAVIIRDNGPGIAKEQIDRVFMPFFTTKKGGSGLGLSIVARLVEALGGKVGVVSEVGWGTEFHLHFRAVGKNSHPASPASAATAR